MIERAAADKLGLAEFGELHVAGMAGRIQSRFRRAQTLSLGPLTIDTPLFMCVGLASRAPFVQCASGSATSCLYSSGVNAGRFF